MERKFSLREESKKEYTVTRKNGCACSEDLRDGALLRIADSLELMIKERKKSFLYYEHRIAGLKGYIKRMKK